MVNGEITTIAEKFRESLNPLRIYLFGSYARGDYNAKSDYDFYIIVPDENYDNIEQTNTAYCSLIGMKRKPVDIVEPIFAGVGDCGFCFLRVVATVDDL